MNISITVNLWFLVSMCLIFALAGSSWERVLEAEVIGIATNDAVDFLAC